MTADENDNSDWADWFEQIFAEWDTPESKLKFEQGNKFEREVLYAGLTDLNPASPRVALLTFEHQGCPQFEQDTRAEEN
jgi:hypothetical protein